MRYKLAIFDFDGTLADSFPFFVNAINDVADTHRFRKIDVAEIETLRCYDARRILNYLGLPLWKVPIVATSFRIKMADNIDKIPLFAGVADMLSTLSRSGILLGLITSNSYSNVSRILKPENLSLVANCQCGTSLFGKQSRLKKILRRTGIQPNEAIYIGDEIRDLEAARAENVDFGAVSWGYTRADAFIKHSPAKIFACMEDIASTIA